MASGDRTGPMGQGSGTGRALGYCPGYDEPGYTKRIGGMGRGQGLGFRGGRGLAHGRGFHFDWPFRGHFPGSQWRDTFSRDDEINALKSQKEELELMQKNIEKRLGDLEKTKKRNTIS
jgi:hypothetical protein